MSETSASVGKVLEHIAQLLELKGENPFKIRAYTNAARALESLSEPIENIVAEGRLGEIEGIGKAITEKVTELVTTGKLAYYEELKGSFPEEIFELFELQGLGAKKIKALHDQLGVSSVEDLERVCKEGKQRSCPDSARRRKPSCSRQSRIIASTPAAFASTWWRCWPSNSSPISAPMRPSGRSARGELSTTQGDDRRPRHPGLLEATGGGFGIFHPPSVG